MTEDETFRKLAQRPFEEVRKRILSEQFGRLGGVYRSFGSARGDTTCRDLILKECGWTLNEYMKAEELTNPLLYRHLKMIKQIT